MRLYDSLERFLPLLYLKIKLLHIASSEYRFPIPTFNTEALATRMCRRTSAVSSCTLDELPLLLLLFLPFLPF